jgi:hypothetical protein
MTEERMALVEHPLDRLRLALGIRRVERTRARTPGMASSVRCAITQRPFPLGDLLADSTFDKTS